MTTIKTGYNFAQVASVIKRDESATVCLEGGGRSGKTRDLCTFNYLIASTGMTYIDPVTRVKRKVQTIAIVGEHWAWLKLRAYKDFIDHLKEYGIFDEKCLNKTDHIYTVNGVKFMFIGADDPEKFKGFSADISWINEPVPGFSKDSYDFIKMRTGWYTVLDWNPVLPDPGKGIAARHWCYQLADQRGVHFIKSTVLMNPFAPSAVRQTILGYEPTPENIENGTANPRLWQIFGLGLRASSKGLVYENFYPIQTTPQSMELIGYGGDFGFTNDPTAMVAVYKMRTNPNGTNRVPLFAKTLIYDTGLLNSHIAQRQAKLSIDHSKYQVWDSASPKDVTDLYITYRIKAVGAEKGAGSIVSGINKVKEFDIFVLENDPLNTERCLYSNKLVKGTEDTYYNEPMPGQQDHALDALRYCITTLKVKSNIV